MKVRVITDTSPKPCKCGSWLAHWKNFSDRTLRSYCPVKNCLDKEMIGAHVQKVNSNDEDYYVIPLCRTHSNTRGQTLEVFEAIKFVSVNVKETCAKVENKSSGEYDVDAVNSM